MTFQKYENHLNSLLEKGHIASYDDNCSKNINYVIRFNRAALQSRIEKDQVYGLLKMGEAETENITCLDENGKLIIFKNVNDLIRYFVNFRLSFYDKRKDYIINQLNRRHLYLTNKARFIKAIIDGKLKVNNVPKAQIVEFLEKNKFEQIEGSYNYLLSMQIYNLTKEKYEELLNEVTEVETEISQITKIEPIDMYKTDLKDLRKKLAK
jgi:DNA topoisomerase-2